MSVNTLTTAVSVKWWLETPTVSAVATSPCSDSSGAVYIHNVVYSTTDITYAQRILIGYSWATLVGDGYYVGVQGYGDGNW